MKGLCCECRAMLALEWLLLLPVIVEGVALLEFVVSDVAELLVDVVVVVVVVVAATVVVIVLSLSEDAAAADEVEAAEIPVEVVVCAFMNDGENFILPTGGVGTKFVVVVAKQLV